MIKFRNLAITLLATSAMAAPITASAASVAKLQARANQAATVIGELTSADDKGIPDSLLQKATCIVSIPGVVKAAFIFGARGGAGIATCRTSSGWSAPSFVTLGGGSFGFQIGVSATDLILVFVNANAINRLDTSNFTLGGDASIAAGPLGRSAEAGTDYKLDSEIYSYSRSRGLFAGIALNGAVLKVDGDANAEVYGASATTKDILTSSGAAVPASMRPFVSNMDAMQK